MNPRKPRLDDLVIILPGITGSVLQKDGADIWAMSGRSLWGALKTGGAVLEELALDFERDDPDVADLGDGITADRLIDRVSILPGITAIDGYTDLVDMVQQRFKVLPGTVGDPAPANFYSFAYDWRRDNRSNARRLQAFIDDRLPVWRAFVGSEEPGVILLAHSMGGLIARYYLEVLGGNEHANALFTFGTPFRGAPKAVGALSNGIKKAWLDLSEMLRSFTSVYQLLPIYEVVALDGGRRGRVAEIDGLPGIDQVRAADALEFHREIERALERNPREAYLTLPFVGFRQPTLQSAALVDGRLHMSKAAPVWLDERLAGGDGTVPRVSAVPIEMSNDLRESYSAEGHGSLQASGRILDDVHQRLLALSSAGLGNIRGQGYTSQVNTEPAVGIDVEDLFANDETVRVSVETFNLSQDHAPKITLMTSDRKNVDLPDLRLDGDRWTASVEGMDPGVYQVRVDAGTASAHAAFEVLP